MDEEVSALMLGRFRGNEKDNFGKEPERRNVLLIDRTMKLTPNPSSRLLQLPTEILGDVVDLLADDKPTLANLALANTDCRQLARTAQFCELNLDYSPQMHSLVRHLMTEGKARLASPDQPSIGSCIRRITVASSRYYLAMQHFELYSSIFGTQKDQYDQEQRKRFREAANAYYAKAWRDSIVLIIALSMPNLEVVVWKDAFVLPADFFETLMLSSVRHLKLQGVPFHHVKTLSRHKWRLQSLELDIHPCDKLMFGSDAIGEDAAWAELSSGVTSILERCSSTLTSLTWSTRGMPTAASAGRPKFLQLRSFKTAYLAISPETMEAVLSAPLRHLSIGFIRREHWQKLDAVADKHLKLKKLQKFIFGMGCAENMSLLTKILSSNSHLDLVSIGDTPDELLGEKIIPTLGSGIFTNLTSLSLHWHGPAFQEDTAPHIARISEESLAILGTLTSLRQLRLIAGIDVGWRNQWLIDHDAIIAHLYPLRRLEKLALCRDTYERHGLEEEDFEAYYECKYLWNGEGITYARPQLDEEADYFAKARLRVWEAEKRRREEVQRRVQEEVRNGEVPAAVEELDLDDASLNGNADEGEDDGEDHPNGTMDMEDDNENEAHDSDDHDANDDDDQETADEDTDDDGDQDTASNESDDGSQWSEPHDPRYDELSTDELWELSHRNFILCDAERYAGTFPKLEWIYIGQWPIKIKVPGSSAWGNAVPLSDERDSCRSLLNKWFDLEDIDDD